MEEYKPPYTITEKMLNLVSSISTSIELCFPGSNSQLLMNKWHGF